MKKTMQPMSRSGFEKEDLSLLREENAL